MSNLSPSALITVQVRSIGAGRFHVVKRLVNHRKRSVFLRGGRQVHLRTDQVCEFHREGAGPADRCRRTRGRGRRPDVNPITRFVPGRKRALHRYGISVDLHARGNAWTEREIAAGSVIRMVLMPAERSAPDGPYGVGTCVLRAGADRLRAETDAPGNALDLRVAFRQNGARVSR